MVLAYTQEHVYHHPWDRVTAAAFRKFTDPSSSSVLSHVSDVHTLSHRRPLPHLLRTVRSLTVRTPPLPFPLRRLLGGHPSLLCHCLESTSVDALSRRMDVVARNFTLRSLIHVEETSTYVPHPDNPLSWTLFRQETRILCRPLSALAVVAGKVEERCAERFLQNSAKGREVVEAICRCLESDGSRSAAV